MAVTVKRVYIAVLILQVTLVGIYFVVRGVYMWPLTYTVGPPACLVGSHTFLEGPLTPLERTIVKTDQLMQNVTPLSSGPNSSLLEAALGNKTTIVGDKRGVNFPRLQEQLAGDATTQKGLSAKATSQSEVFQPVDDQAAWVYSAFDDPYVAEKGDSLVRVFGLFHFQCVLVVYCSFTYGKETLTLNGSVTVLPDSHKSRHVPVDIKCPFSGNIRPAHVSISFKADQEPTNRLQILYPGPRIRNFTVCYSVLNSNFSLAVQLIENIEMNRILGADHFMVYTYNVNPTIDQILNRYQQDGIMTVLKWPLPTTETWYFGQVLALNDCTYRNRNTSRFVVVVDTDEIVVPRIHKSWMELIHGVSPHEQDVSRLMNASSVFDADNKQTACFMVRSSTFARNRAPKWDIISPKLKFGKDQRKNIVKYYMLILSQHWRIDKVLRAKFRSKYIGRPELILYAGIHYPHTFLNNASCLVMNDSLGIIHHYRAWKRNLTFVIDTSALKYKDTLYKNVMQRIGQFPNIFN